jgi:hypothetical protein
MISEFTMRETSRWFTPSQRPRNVSAQERFGYSSMAGFALQFFCDASLQFPQAPAFRQT